MTVAGVGWRGKAQAVEDGRQKDRADHEHRLRARLKSLVQAKVCHPSAVFWLGAESNPGGRVHVSFKKGDVQAGAHSALKLSTLEHLRPDSMLTVSVVLEKRTSLLLSYAIGLRGLTADSGRPWYARIDLDEEQKGHGPCSHPNLHCHVGNDPDGDDNPTARVPLPWLAPDDALTWLLATVDSRFEPRDN
ncbi:MAG TPA: hypothetical protein VE057_23320 [Archangium sp.]|nr:hypothetical protein [Archangium sp.]